MWTGVVTNAGAALLARWAQGGTLAIVAAKAGTGTVPVVQLIMSTDVAGDSHDLSIIDHSAADGGVKYTVQFSTEETAYTAMQVGIYASLDGGARTLIAIYQAASGEGISIPATSESMGWAFTFGATVQMSNTGSLTVEIDESAYVTRGTLDDALEAKADVSASLSLTAQASSWQGSEPAMLTLTATGVTASNDILVGAGAMTTAQREAMVAAQLACVAQAADSITLAAYGETPAVDLPIIVFILG